MDECVFYYTGLQLTQSWEECRAGCTLGIKRGQLFTHFQVYLFVLFADCIRRNLLNVIIAFLLTL